VTLQVVAMGGYEINGPWGPPSLLELTVRATQLLYRSRKRGAQFVERPGEVGKLRWLLDFDPVAVLPGGDHQRAFLDERDRARQSTGHLDREECAEEDADQ